ncbi:RHS repeat domain-containing protein [Paenibacillus donghaensis]|nr:RHS repeat-associated core domain-containing protein [Paenibacillus donghaensis]
MEEQWDEYAGKWTHSEYHYDNYGRPIYAADPAGNITTIGYDTWGTQNRAVDPFGNIYVSDNSLKQRHSISYLIDVRTNEKLNYVEEYYDQWGNKRTFKTWPQTSEPISESYRYDLLGNVTAYTDPKNNQNNEGVTTAYRYDALGRLSAVKDALSQTTNYSYDGNGQLTNVSVESSGGTPQQINSKTYNELGLLTEKRDPASQSEAMQYNTLGQLLSKKDRNGTLYGYQYDERQQLTSVTLNGLVNNTAQTQQIRSIFGGDGIRTRVMKTYLNGSQTAAQSLTVDSLGRTRANQASVGSHSATIRNTLDTIDRMTQIQDVNLGFYTNYQYNKTRLDKVQTNGSAALTSAASANVQYSYTGNGLVQSITYPALTDGSVLKTEYTYNKALNWVESVTNKKGSMILSKYVYGYDNNGNITSSTETKSDGTTQTTSYAYDALNRLTTTVHPGGGRDSYTYDVRGNRLTQEQSVSSPAVFEDTNYTYDLQNTLTALTKGSSTTSFMYYADGLRFKKSTSGVQTQYNYNFNGEVITEEKSNGQKANYVRGDRVLVKKDKIASKDYYYLYNGHGDVVQIVDTSGKPVNSYAYDVWGNITSQTEGISNPFKYTGEIYDEETGLYYLRARYYDPSMGRFLNEDTYEGQIDNPLTQNLYTYVENNPLTHIDPTGHYTESQVDLLITTARIAGSKSQLYWDIRSDLGEQKPLLYLGEKQRNQWLYLFNMATSSKSTDGQSSWAKSQLMITYGEDQAIKDTVYGMVLSMYGGGGNSLKPAEAAAKIIKAERVGSALNKSDPGHRAASYLSEKVLAMGQTFVIKGGDEIERTLLQVKGELNGKSGIYEYILTQEGKVTHQRFIVKGKITGQSNQKP